MTFQSRPFLRLVVVSACVAALGVVAASARADWHEPVGGASPINADSKRNAQAVALANVAGVPHVAWSEDTTASGQGNSNGINVARLNPDGTGWTRLAPGSRITRRATASTTGPNLADVEGVPWVTWAENTDTGREVHVARLSPSGAAWTPMDDSAHPINHDPNGRAEDLGRPNIAASGSRPYVAFWERDPGTGSLFPGPPMAPGEIWVMRLGADGTSWEAVGGGPVNVDLGHDALVPALAIIDGKPWVSYIQVVLPDNAPPFFQIRVARLSDSGTGWTQVGAPVAEMAPTQPQESPLALVDGVPTIAVANANRIDVFRSPAAGGSEWQRVGDGPASPDGADASSPSLTSIGATPWVAWNQSQGGLHAARLVDRTWEQAGSAIGGSGGSDSSQGGITSINGFPWIPFTLDDGSTQGGPNTPGCCGQARVSRLEPTFGASRAFPSADTAALLAGVEAYGLPYPIGFEYGEEGATAPAGTTPQKTADGTFTIGEARGLKPSTFYWFRPFATAGTPLPLVRGTEETFVTPPSSAAAAPPATTGSQTTVISQPGRLIVAIVRATTRVRRGARVRLRLLSSEPGTMRLTVVRGRRVVRTITRTIRAGTQTLTWGTRRAAPGRYRLRVHVRSNDGRSASDGVNVRVLRRRSSTR